MMRTYVHAHATYIAILYIVTFFAYCGFYDYALPG